MSYLPDGIINGKEYQLRIPPPDRERLMRSFLTLVYPRCDMNDLYQKLVASGDVEERQVAAYVRTIFPMCFFASPRLADDNFFIRQPGQPKIYYVTQDGCDFMARGQDDRVRD